MLFVNLSAVIQGCCMLNSFNETTWFGLLTQDERNSGMDEFNTIFQKAYQSWIHTCRLQWKKLKLFWYILHTLKIIKIQLSRRSKSGQKGHNWLAKWSVASSVEFATKTPNCQTRFSTNSTVMAVQSPRRWFDALTVGHVVLVFYCSTQILAGRMRTIRVLVEQYLTLTVYHQRKAIHTL